MGSREAFRASLTMSSSAVSFGSRVVFAQLGLQVQVAQGVQDAKEELQLQRRASQVRQMQWGFGRALHTPSRHAVDDEKVLKLYCMCCGSIATSCDDFLAY